MRKGEKEEGSNMQKLRKERTGRGGRGQAHEESNAQDKGRRMAKQRAIKQLGSLGIGNHFLEIQKVDAIYNESIAK